MGKERIYDWPADDWDWLGSDTSLLIRFPDREPGPARWDLDLELELDEVGKRYGTRLLWIARDNQEVSIDASSDLRVEEYPDTGAEPPLLGAIRSFVAERVDSRASVRTPKYFDLDRWWGPKLRPDSWVVPMIIKDFDTSAVEALSDLILEHEDFRSEANARDSILAYGGFSICGLGRWAVDKPTRDEFLRRVINFAVDPDHVAQRTAIFETSFGIHGGVVARRGMIIVVFVDGGSQDAVELLEEAAPHVLYGAAERIGEVAPRYYPGWPDRIYDLSKRALSVWSGDEKRILDLIRSPDSPTNTLGSRIELLQDSHLSSLSRSDRKRTERVGEGRYLVRRQAGLDRSR